MKPFFLITGMHRSGTSFLARSLNLAGVYLGDLDSLISHEWSFAGDNLRGHWENKKFMKLGDLTLACNNGAWDNVPENITISEDIGKEISKCTEELVKHQSLASGFKDPRILLCFDSWTKYLPKDFIVIGIFRDPLKVAESLKTRNQFSYEKSLNLWRIYNQKLIYILDKHDGFLFDFDWTKEKLFSEISLMLDKLGLPKIDLSHWYSEDLFHSDKTYQSDYPLPAEISSLYSKLKERSKTNDKIIVNKASYSQREFIDIMGGFLDDMQDQNRYFKNLNEQHLATINKATIDLRIQQSSLEALSKELTALQNINSENQKIIDNKELQIDRLQALIKEKESQISGLKSMLENSQKMLEAIYQSFTWKLLRKYDRTIRKIIK